MGDLRATFFVWEMLVLDRRVFCFRGWKSPQGLYNRSKSSWLVPGEEEQIAYDSALKGKGLEWHLVDGAAVRCLRGGRKQGTLVSCHGQTCCISHLSFLMSCPLVNCHV